MRLRSYLALSLFGLAMLGQSITAANAQIRAPGSANHSESASQCPRQGQLEEMLRKHDRIENILNKFGEILNAIETERLILNNEFKAKRLTLDADFKKKRKDLEDEFAKRRLVLGDRGDKRLLSLEEEFKKKLVALNEVTGEIFKAEYTDKFRDQLLKLLRDCECAYTLFHSNDKYLINRGYDIEKLRYSLSRNLGTLNFDFYFLSDPSHRIKALFYLEKAAREIDRFDRKYLGPPAVAEKVVRLLQEDLEALRIKPEQPRLLVSLRGSQRKSPARATLWLIAANPLVASCAQQFRSPASLPAPWAEWPMEKEGRSVPPAEGNFCLKAEAEGFKPRYQRLEIRTCYMRGCEPARNVPGAPAPAICEEAAAVAVERDGVISSWSVVSCDTAIGRVEDQPAAVSIGLDPSFPTWGKIVLGVGIPLVVGGIVGGIVGKVCADKKEKAEATLYFDSVVR